MAHFIGGVEGNRGPATRLGTANSGIHAFAQGWNVGVHVGAYVDQDGEDYVEILATGGSSGHCPSLRIGKVQIVDGKLTFIPDKEISDDNQTHPGD